MELTLLQQLFFFIILTLRNNLHVKCADSLDVPLINSIRKMKVDAPLKATIDISALSKELAPLIQMEVKRAVKNAIEETMKTFTEQKLNESIEIMDMKFSKEISDLHLVQSEEKKKIITEMKEIQAVMNVLQTKLNQVEKIPDTITDLESRATKFLLTFIENHYNNKPQHIYIIPDNQSGTCTITSPFTALHTSVNVLRNVTAVYNLSQSFGLTNGRSHKGIYIECNVPVSVIGFNEERRSSDGFLVLPVEMLGFEYIVPSYITTYQSLPSLMGIAAIHNNTNININIRSKGKVNFNGKSYQNGEQISVDMSAFDTIQIPDVNGDLSGTLITSSKPIAVVSGDQCVNVKSSYCSHVSEMIIAVKDFSDVFIIPLLDNKYISTLRAFAYNKTIITTSAGRFNKFYTILSQNYKEFDYDEQVAVIWSSNKILLQLFGNSAARKADAFMTTIPGINQYLGKYLFHVPDFHFKSHISIIIKSDEISGLYIDDQSVAVNTMRNVTISGTKYSTFSHPVSTGRHTAEHSKSIPFGLIVYGKRLGDGYGYLAGMRLLSKKK